MLVERGRNKPLNRGRQEGRGVSQTLRVHYNKAESTSVINLPSIITPQWSNSWLWDWFSGSLWCSAAAQCPADLPTIHQLLEKNTLNIKSKAILIEHSSNLYISFGHFFQCLSHSFSPSIYFFDSRISSFKSTETFMSRIPKWSRRGFR